ncbi:MAG: gliding motility-associated C-terminal domain-containing protein [Saprospiraceae bacterium]|nr:gliding motility-associated C-terminal domain-containing protein [Saprospiraceae bacterium]
MRYLFIIPVLFTGFSFTLSGQSCDGNLGENIFVEGDFGSGSSNILLANPNIAPGYMYTTAAPPDDGFYTITNDISLWPSSFNWLEIQDNSPDPFGYMMIVNASYEPGLFYEKEVEGLCENTLYEFSADIFNLIPPGGNAIKPNVSFLLDGVVLYNSGDVPENGQWNNYGFTFTTQPGQSAITLSLQNNAPGGGGNDLALDNISFRPCGPEALILPEEVANICEDGSPIDIEATIVGSQYTNPQIQWQQSFDEGLTWVDLVGENDFVYTHTNLSGGFYYYRYLLANDPGNLLNSKCRVVSNIKIINVVPKFYTVIDSLCEGLTYVQGPNNYTDSGIYIDSFISYTGCDSIVTLDLTFTPDQGLDATFNLKDPGCADASTGSISVANITNGTAPFTVYYDGELDSLDTGLNNLPAGTYDIQIIDYFGCSLETMVELGNPDLLTVDLGPDQEIELGETIQITPILNQEVEDYTWQPAGVIDCQTACTSVDWTPPNSMYLFLTVADATDCVAADSVYVEVIKTRKVYIPTAFSPNYDGINDQFLIFGVYPNVIQIDQLVIFDRWGEKVFDRQNFEANIPALGWDGTFRGKKQSPGIYTYLARIRFLDNEVILYKGNISLVR